MRSDLANSSPIFRLCKLKFKSAFGMTTSKEDVAALYPPVQSGVEGVGALVKATVAGSAEMKKLLLQECDYVLECKFCRALFRAVTNFVTHKRLYCRGLTSDLDPAQQRVAKQMEKAIDEVMAKKKEEEQEKEKEKEQQNRSFDGAKISKKSDIAKDITAKVAKRSSDRLKRNNIIAAINKRATTVDVQPPAATEKVPIHVVPKVYRDVPVTTMENGIQKIVGQKPTSFRAAMPEDKTAFIMPQTLSKYGEMALRVRKETKHDGPMDLSTAEAAIITRLDKADCLIFLNINTLRCNSIDCIGVGVKPFDSLRSLALHCGQKHSRAISPDDEYLCYLCDKTFKEIEEIGEHYELEHGESVSIENVTPPKTQPSEGVKKSESPMEVDSKIGIDEEEKEDSSNDGNEANEGKKEEMPNGEETSPLDDSASGVRPSRQIKRPNWLDEFDTASVQRKRRRTAHSSSPTAGDRVFRKALVETVRKKRTRRLLNSANAANHQTSSDADQSATHYNSVRDAGASNESNRIAASRVQSAEKVKDEVSEDLQSADKPEQPRLKVRYTLIKERIREKTRTMVPENFELEEKSDFKEPGQKKIKEENDAEDKSDGSEKSSNSVSKSDIVLPPTNSKHDNSSVKNSINQLQEIIKKTGAPFTIAHLTPRARRSFVRKHSSWTPSEAEVILEEAVEEAIKKEKASEDVESTNNHPKAIDYSDISQVPVLMGSDQQKTFFKTVDVIQQSPNKRCYYCNERCIKQGAGLSEAKEAFHIRRHLAGHFRAIRLRCKLCQAGAFFTLDMRKHLMERGCDQMHKLPADFTLKEGISCMTIQQADELIEIVDQVTPGKVNLTSGAIVSAHSIKPYFPNKDIEDQILGVGKIIGITGTASVARRIPISGTALRLTTLSATKIQLTSKPALLQNLNPNTVVATFSEPNLPTSSQQISVPKPVLEITVPTSSDSSTTPEDTPESSHDDCDPNWRSPSRPESRNTNSPCGDFAPTKEETPEPEEPKPKKSGKPEGTQPQVDQETEGIL
ncbi:hypothetical protein WR25_14287 isoform B [Diploscapter pachys]|uniref:C2H2-type domain-containing protein n=1 Tax=Diploscapter pachys TaxID=2018661 RepID=A0A2A2KH17_9BILA|nr:hypothetical protein WR25_14287 isoform B [Diploscapter pachys]